MHVLIADDDKNVLDALQLALKLEGITSIPCQSPDSAIAAVDNEDVTAAVIDLNYSTDTTSGEEGLALIESLRAHNDNLPIIVMTGWGTIDLAVKAMQKGALDFIEKPWPDNDEIVSKVQRLVERKEQPTSFETGLVTNSSAMQDVMELAASVAQSDLPILITGENGTGKTLLARQIHDRSHRAGGPFVSVNMGGITESLFESEMFGHERGAFTDARQDRIGRVEIAEGGTLFLDEIGSIPASQQPKLLRLLEERQFERLGSSETKAASVRVISATNSSLEDQVNAGAFRADLYYRLNGITIEIPPLRKRTTDVLPLAKYFMNGETTLTVSAQEALVNYPWPGNIRELRHVLQRASLLSKGNTEIEAKHLQLPDTVIDDQPLTLKEAESQLIERTLLQCNGDVNKAAATLGVSRSALYRRLKAKE